MDIVSPYALYFDHKAVLFRKEWWRVITPFFFFGYLNFHTIFGIMFVSRYSKMLEEQLFYDETLDYLFLVMFKSAMIMFFVMVSPFKSMDTLFLGYTLGISLMYYWSRQNPEFKFSLFGCFTFSAPYLPWMILLIGKLFGGEVFTNFIGIVVGHIVFYGDQKLPKYTNLHVFRCPQFM